MLLALYRGASRVTFSKLKQYRLCHHRLCETESKKFANFKEKISGGPSLSSFLETKETEIETTLDPPPYILRDGKESPGKVFVETYGCQMNVNDTEIIYSIMKNAGFTITDNIIETDVIFVVTCAIREGAEQKIWRRLKSLGHLKKKRCRDRPIKIGVLGCMAERLKHQLLEQERMVDIVAGPDSYKDLPHLLAHANLGQKAVNVMLSADETYADIMPVRIDPSKKSAFVSVMRGCDNMCSFCIVPFTRGHERSRPVSSIVDEVKHLSEQGVREVTLLGQNVNSYRDLSDALHSDSLTVLSPGFQSTYKLRSGGLRFADLLDRVASVDPEMRVRFTSPHPKDFPDEVLHVIRDRANICKAVHLPAQSGSSSVLASMRRGYTREAYMGLVQHIRSIVPGVALTSDFICGFCGESEDDHQGTLSLMRAVRFHFTYIFPYSMRQKTRAHRQLVDDVAEDVKRRRTDEAYKVFRDCTLQLHQGEIGNLHLVQVLGPSKRSACDWSGRNDWNTKVIFPFCPVPSEPDATHSQLPKPGDYVAVQITACTSQVLKGIALCHTSLQNFHAVKQKLVPRANQSLDAVQ